MGFLLKEHYRDSIIGAEVLADVPERNKRSDSQLTGLINTSPLIASDVRKVVGPCREAANSGRVFPRDRSRGSRRALSPIVVLARGLSLRQ
jgi:hypothetical protein